MSQDVTKVLDWLSCPRCGSNVGYHEGWKHGKYIACKNCTLKYQLAYAERGGDLLPTWDGVPPEFEQNIEERREIVRQWHELRIYSSTTGWKGGITNDKNRGSMDPNTRTWERARHSIHTHNMTS